MKFRTALITLACLSLLLFGLDKTGLIAGPRGFLGLLTEPVQLGWYRASQAVGDRLGIVGRIGSLAEENLLLRDENDRLKAENSQVSLLKGENELLRSQLGVSSSKSYQFLDTQTLGYVPGISNRELLLDRGGNAGVKLGQTVTLGRVVLGKINRVEPDRSTLQLITDPDMKVLATSAKGARGLLIGQFQSTAKLTKILQTEKIDVGDEVLTSGEEDWPKGFAIGQVTKVTKKDNELFQEAEVRPAVSYDNLGVVFIILGVK